MPGFFFMLFFFFSWTREYTLSVFEKCGCNGETQCVLKSRFSALTDTSNICKMYLEMEILCGKSKSVIKTGKTELECCKEGIEGEVVFGRKTSVF